MAAEGEFSCQRQFKCYMAEVHMQAVPRAVALGDAQAGLAAAASAALRQLMESSHHRQLLDALGLAVEIGVPPQLCGEMQLDCLA